MCCNPHGKLLRIVLCFNVLFSLLSGCPCQAQTPEPQYLGQYAFLGPTGQLVPLESAQGKSETKSRSVFIANKVTSAFVVEGAASSVRVGSLAHFIVRMSPGSEAVDPNTLISLRAFTVEGGKRTVPTASASGGIFQSTKGGTAAVTTIPLSFQKYGQSSLEIIPEKPLAPGEYLFGRPFGGQPVICFGVDANGPVSASATALAAASVPVAPKPPAMPAFIKWSEPLQVAMTTDVKSACESTDPVRQAFCFGVFQSFIGEYENQQDSESYRPFCFPKDVTAATLRDAFLSETRELPDQLQSPITIFWNRTEDDHFRCPTAAKPKRTIPAKKK